MTKEARIPLQELYCVKDATDGIWGKRKQQKLHCWEFNK
jgi:hypothetical protein